MSRFTFDAAQDQFPIWSPDGSRIVFYSLRKGTRDLYQKPSGGAGAEELVLEFPQDKTATDWSAGRPVPALPQRRPTDGPRPLGAPYRGGSQALGVPEDRLRRTLGPVLAGRPLGGVPVANRSES
jgi:hypothetical protein